MRAVGDKLDGGWLFRGVSRTSFSLTPSIGRRPHSATPLQISEQRLLDRFKREVRPYLSFQPSDDWEWLAIAQHHGVPTRLIDWSETPLIAAYFAVWDHDDSSGGVYVVRQPNVRGAETALSPFSVPDVRYFYPGHVTRRITSQRGLFTVHPDPRLEYSPEDALLLEIPNSQKPEYRSKLDGLGVNHASVFPDIDGLSRHLAWVFRGKETHALGTPTTAALPLKERHRIDPSDPQKGAWGGQQSADGWTLEGEVGREDRGWFRVSLTVRGVGGKKVSQPVIFHLHDSFDEPEQTVRPVRGVASLNFWA